MILGAIFSLSAGLPNASVHQARPTIKIGALGPLAITSGNDMKNGVEMAVEEINSGAGVDIGGVAHDFELIIETSSGDLGIPDPAVGVAAGMKLIEDDNVTAIIGGFRTEVVLGIQLSPSVALDRPFLGIGNAAPIVSPHFWRVGPANVSMIERNIIDFYAYGLVPDQGVRNITIIREEAAWTLSMALIIKQFFSAMGPSGVGLLPQVNFTDDIVLQYQDTHAAVTNALSLLTGDIYQGLKVNALLTIITGPVGTYVPQAWAAHDLPQFIAGLNVESQASTFFDETEGAYYGEIELETCPLDVNPTPTTAAFRNTYFDLYDEQPTYTAFSSYDAVYILKAAIEAAESLVYTDIESALANIEYEGTVYTIKFTSEPEPHWTVAINDTTGLPYYVPILTSTEYPEGVPMGTFQVHDLYTNGTYGLDGRPYNVGYWAQMQQSGVKETVWHDPAVDPKGFNDQFTPFDNQRNLSENNIVWPIDHAEHGWKPEETSTLTEMTDTWITGTKSSHITTESLCEENDPEITITGIEDGGTYSGTVEIIVVVTDESVIDEATISVESGDINEIDIIGLSFVTGTIWTGSYDFNTKEFPDDTYWITIRVYDVCDNVETIRYEITINNEITQESQTESSKTEMPEETKTKESPEITPGFNSINVLLGLGAFAAVIWHRRRK